MIVDELQYAIKKEDPKKMIEVLCVHVYPVCLCVRVCVCVCVCVRVCVCVCTMHACIYVCVYSISYKCKQ